ncbi:PepSY domain-containing protein [Thiohalorhabdus methylotrophus]|uniref:PepSY domain-containing protein n=1 Tax=Thiohalorhabdus methylotrophus TaxID=3242694 RepID=A0ABV4TVA0_9GAMM
MSRFPIYLLLAVLTGGALLTAALAEPGGEETGHVRELRKAGKILPLEQILARARKHFPDSRMVEVELQKREGLHLYEVELIDSGGTFRELYFNAETGALRSSETED